MANDASSPRAGRRNAALHGLLLFFIAALFGTSSCESSAAPREVTGAGFKYYVLSIYWQPTWCLEFPNSDECGGPSRRGFIVRGLTPVLDWNSPTNCHGDDVLSDALITSLKDLMASRRVVEREWAEHGTCSGESPERYFALVRQAYDSVNLPHFDNAGSSPMQTIHQVTKAFTNADPGLPAQAITLGCSENPPRLQEVRICLSKSLASNYCTGEMIRSSCTTLNLQIPAAP